MGDWLGTGRIADQFKLYQSYSSARSYVRKLKLKNVVEWMDYCKGDLTKLGKKPIDIPSNPSNTYRHNGWEGYGDWLGTGAIAARLRVYRSFSKARGFVKKLKLKGSSEWRAYCKGEMTKLGALPGDIPAQPSGTYADNGWKGMADWLGNDRPLRKKRKSRA